jgi:hypothetical protein
LWGWVGGRSGWPPLPPGSLSSFGAEQHILSLMGSSPGPGVKASANVELCRPAAMDQGLALL